MDDIVYVDTSSKVLNKYVTIRMIGFLDMWICGKSVIERRSTCNVHGPMLRVLISNYYLKYIAKFLDVLCSVNTTLAKLHSITIGVARRQGTIVISPDGFRCLC